MTLKILSKRILSIEMMQVGGKTKKYAFAKTAVIRGM